MATMERKTPGYRVLGYITSRETETPRWIYLEIRLHAAQFEIHVSPANFRNSPARSAEFQRYFAFLHSQLYFGPETILIREPEADGVTEDQCFDWAVAPCLAEFERLAPVPAFPADGQLLLSHFLGGDTFYCELAAVDDVLSPGEIEVVEPKGHGHSSRNADGGPSTTSSPSFTPAEIAVICDNPELALDPNWYPKRVRVGQQELHFREAMEPRCAEREVSVHEQIAAANLGPAARTSRLFGAVRNNKGQLLGSLLYPIEKRDLLAFAVGPATDTMKGRWVQQIRATVAVLHKAGIVWGNVCPRNVLIDVHGDAWIVGFEAGRPVGWVDAAEEGTPEGDLHGVERIVRFIASGGDLPVQKTKAQL